MVSTEDAQSKPKRSQELIHVIVCFFHQYITKVLIFYEFVQFDNTSTLLLDLNVQGKSIQRSNHIFWFIFIFSSCIFFYMSMLESKHTNIEMSDIASVIWMPYLLLVQLVRVNHFFQPDYSSGIKKTPHFQ